MSFTNCTAREVKLDGKGKIEGPTSIGRAKGVSRVYVKRDDALHYFLGKWIGA